MAATLYSVKCLVSVKTLTDNVQTAKDLDMLQRDLVKVWHSKARRGLQSTN